MHSNWTHMHRLFKINVGILIKNELKDKPIKCTRSTNKQFIRFLAEMDLNS